MRTTSVLVPLGLVAAATLSSGCAPPGGSLDTSFDGDGVVIVTTPVEASQFHDVAPSPGGKVVGVGGADNSTGDMFLARYNANGSPDSSFGTGGSGSATIDIPGAPDGARGSDTATAV